jgi:hypothetical protein
MFKFFLILDNDRLFFYRNYMVDEVHPVTAKKSIFDVILKAIRANCFSLFGRVVVSWTHCRFHSLFMHSWFTLIHVCEAELGY